MYEKYEKRLAQGLLRNTHKDSTFFCILSNFEKFEADNIRRTKEY
jgi:hypothetical protein